MDALIRAMQKEAAERGCRTRCPRDHNLDKSRDKFPGGNTKHASDGDKVAGWKNEYSSYSSDTNQHCANNARCRADCTTRISISYLPDILRSSANRGVLIWACDLRSVLVVLPYVHFGYLRKIGHWEIPWDWRKRRERGQGCLILPRIHGTRSRADV